MAIDANDPRRGSFATGSSRQTADAAKASASKARASSPSISRSTPTRSKSPAASSTAARGASSFGGNKAFGDNDGRSRTSVSKPSGEQQARKTQPRASFPSIKSDGGRDSRPSLVPGPKQTFAQQPSLGSFRPTPRPTTQDNQRGLNAFRPTPRPRAAAPVTAPVTGQALDAPRTAEPVAQRYLDGPRTSTPIAERYMTPDALADAFFARLGQTGPIGQAPTQQLDRETANARMDAFAGLEERARREALADAFFARREQAGPIGQAPVQRLDRATANARMDDLSDLENRVELEPEFVNNPLAELGYRTAGGLRSVDYLPFDLDQAALFGGGYGGAMFASDLASDKQLLNEQSQNILASVYAMNPARADAFMDDYVQNQTNATARLIEPGTVGLGPNAMAPYVQSHEFTHKGVDILEDLMRQNPAMRDRVSRGLPMREGLPPNYDPSFYGLVPFSEMGDAGQGAEERMIELQDDPSATWIMPRTADRPVGAYMTMEPTIQYQRDVGTMEYPPTSIEAGQARRQNQIYQELAAEELARQGRPPRATMQGSPRRALRTMERITDRVDEARAGERNRGLLGGIGDLIRGIF